MQDKNVISNEERTRKTRKALIEAALSLFVKKGYGATGTPEIVKKANVTRGALYHNFDDKADLMRAIVDQECAAIGREIERQSTGLSDPIEALQQGSSGFLRAMGKRGRAQIIVVEGPAAIGYGEMISIEDKYTRKSLKEGLEFALSTERIIPLPLEETVDTISSMLDAVALKIEHGADFGRMETVVHAVIAGLAKRADQR